MSYGLIILAFWIERSRMTSCSSFSPQQTPWANRYLFCRFFQRFLHSCLLLWKNWSTFAAGRSFLHCELHKFRTASFRRWLRARRCQGALQLRCAFVFLRTFFLMLKCLLWVNPGLVTAKIEPSLLLVLVKQSVTRCKDICLDYRCARCNFWWLFIQDRSIVSDTSCNTFYWNVSEVNNCRTESLM